MEKEFKISKYRNNGAQIFTGRNKGVEARNDFGLNLIDEEEGIIYILIPSDTWGINPSFFGGLFEGSIKKLGSKFLEKYKFIYSNKEEINESIRKDIEDNVNYIIRNVCANK